MTALRTVTTIYAQNLGARVHWGGSSEVQMHGGATVLLSSCGQGICHQLPKDLLGAVAAAHAPQLRQEYGMPPRPSLTLRYRVDVHYPAANPVPCDNPLEVLI
jgi:hypothetical protein